MSERQMQYGIRFTSDSRVAVDGARAVERALAGVEQSAQRAGKAAAGAYDAFGTWRSLPPIGGQLKGIEMSAKQSAFALRMLPAQMTDIAVGLSSGQNPFTVLMQQGGQLKDMFGGIGPAAAAVVGYMARMVNPFTIAAAAAAAAGYGLYKAFEKPQEPAKDLKTAVSDLSAIIGLVGKASREFSMDNVYKEFNTANAIARQGIIEQIEFQQTLLATQNLMAQKSLSKSLEGVGDYTTLDKLKGAFAASGSEKLARDLGVSRDIAGDMLVSIKGLRDGSGDAGNFMARFGVELAKSSKGAAQQLLADIRAVADGTKDAATAQSRLSEAIKKMRDAGRGGQIAIPDKKSGRESRNGPEDFAVDQAMQYGALYELGIKYVDAVNLQNEAGHKLTEGERILALSKSKLTDAQYREIEALVSGTATKERARITSEAYAASLHAILGPLEERMRQEERAVELYGKTAAQIEALQLARLREARAIAAANGAAPEALEFYDHMIEMQGRLSDAMNQRQVKSDQVDMWKSIESVAHDTWSSIGREGGNTFDMLRRSLRSGVYDLLYQMTLKKWIINIATAVSGGGVAGAALGASGGDLFGKMFDAWSYRSSMQEAASQFAWNAQGGVYSSPDLHGYANTVVTKPTMFAFAQGAGIMGEKPGSPGEAIMPLTRIGGDLGVKVDMGGAASQSVIFQATYHINAPGADVGVESRIRRAMAESEDRTKAWVMSSLDRGSALAYATGRRR